MRRRLTVAAAVAVIAGGLSAGIAVAAGGGPEDGQLMGAAVRRATEAALEHVNGGAVIETDIGDDGAAYSVDIRRADGTVVEVTLDAGFKVIGEEPDDDQAGDHADEGEGTGGD